MLRSCDPPDADSCPLSPRVGARSPGRPRTCIQCAIAHHAVALRLEDWRPDAGATEQREALRLGSTSVVWCVMRRVVLLTALWFFACGGQHAGAPDAGDGCGDGKV